MFFKNTKKFLALVTCVFLISGCDDTFAPGFIESIDETISNDRETLGLVGISVSSDDSNIAMAEITASDKIRITSVSEGSTTITVSCDLDQNAYINICVSGSGLITIDNIVKFVCPDTDDIDDTDEIDETDEIDDIDEINEIEFLESIDETISNDEETLGLVGISVSSDDSNIAIAAITAQDKIRITSVSEGTATITVSCILGNNAFINISVSETGSITIENINKFVAPDIIENGKAKPADETISNDAATLGLVGISVSSSDSNVAEAELSSSNEIRITPVSEGTAVLTVSDISGAKAFIRLSVSEARSIEIRNIVKHSNDAEIRLNRFDLENDMFLLHEGIPAGVPGYYGWYSKPSSTYGLNIPNTWNAMTSWGQVYAEQSLPNPDKEFPLVRAHIKDLQMYIYQKDGTWITVQNVMNPSGAMYIEDFTFGIIKPAEIVNETGGGISVQAGSGFTFHFYPNIQVKIPDRNNIKGIFVTCKARLIGTENYDTPSKYIICIGADYWKDVGLLSIPNFQNNNDIAIGRFKYITPEWNYYTMHTFSQEEAKNIIFPLE